jgi:hypothetical protein
MTDQPSGMTVQKADTAVVFIDPQNDVLSEHGAAWDAVGTRVVENNTRENMERIFKSAKDNGYDVFISPHYFHPTDTTGSSTDRSRPMSSSNMSLRGAAR